MAKMCFAVFGALYSFWNVAKAARWRSTSAAVTPASLSQVCSFASSVSTGVVLVMKPRFLLNTGASSSTLQKEGSRKKPPTAGVEGTAKGAGAKALGEKLGAENGVVVVKGEEKVGVAKEGLASSVLNIEVPAENAEVDITNGVVALAVLVAVVEAT